MPIRACRSLLLATTILAVGAMSLPARADTTTITIPAGTTRVDDPDRSPRLGRFDALVVTGGGTWSIVNQDLVATSSVQIDAGTSVSVGTTTRWGQGSLITPTVLNNGHLDLKTRYGATFSRTIGGSGEVYFWQSSPDRLSNLFIVTGENTYTGGTAILGDVQIGDGGTHGSILGNVADSGTLIFNRSDTVVFSGDISGSGALMQSGSGQLILTGNVSVGRTSIERGRLQIGTGGASGTLASDVEVLEGGVLAFNRSDTIVFGRGITGSGVFQQIGSGTLIITGRIANTRGTVIGSGSTLQIGNGTGTGSIANSVTNNGTLVFNIGTDYTMSSAIAGAGGVVLADSHTLKLTGTNTYTGGTTISAGMLQIGIGGTTGSIVGNVVDNGTLTFNRSDAYTFAGDISGTGGVWQIGPGTITLTGNLTYTGPTVVSQGILITPTSIIAGGHSTVVIDDTLTKPYQFDASFVGTVQIQRSDTYTFANSMSGAVTIVQAGSGTTILTGTNTNAGGITISAGTLQIGNGGTAGSVVGPIIDKGALVFNRSDAVTFGGVISGTGALTKAGTGTLTLSAANTAFTGHTAITGGTLVVAGSLGGDVTVGAGAMLRGHGTIRGPVTNASGVVMPGGSIGTLSVGGYTQGANGTLRLEVEPSGASDLSSSGAVSLAGRLDLVFDPGVTLPARYTAISALNGITGRFDTVTANAPTDLMYGVAYSDTAVSLVVQPAAVGQIYSDLRTSTFTLASAVSDELYGHQSTRHCEGEGTTGRTGNWECPDLSVWYQLIGGIAAFDANGASTGFNHRFVGLMGGADVDVTNGVVLGLTAAYVRGKVDVGGGGANATTDTFALGATADVAVLGGTLNAQGLWLRSTADAERSSQPAGLAAATAATHPQSDAYHVSAQYAHSLLFSDVSGLAGITYTGARFDGVTENGAAPFDIVVRSKDASNAYGDLGLKWGHAFQLRSGAILVPEVTIGGRGYFTDSPAEADTSLADAQGPDFRVPTVAFDRFAFVGGFSLTAARHDGFTLALKARGQISQNSRAAVVSFETRYPF